MSGAPGPTNRQIAMSLGDVIGMEVFSLEYAILIFLHEVGRASQKEVLFGIGCSPATLQRKLGFLDTRGLVGSTVDMSDKRRRVFILTDAARRTLDEELAYFANWGQGGESGVDGLSALVARLERRLGIGIFGYKYKIALVVYYSNGIPNLSLFRESGLSKGNFYSVLKSMVEDGILLTKRDMIDKRIVRYYIDNRVRKKIDNAHRGLSNWSNTGMR